jgi:hypothetical protein
MKNRIFIFLIGILISFTSCKKNNEIDLSGENECSELINSMLQYNDSIFKIEFNKFLSELNLPTSIESDKIGHKDNFNKLIKDLNNCNGIYAKLDCYACLESFPAQSIIIFTIDSLSNNINRKVYLSTPENDYIKLPKLIK